MTRETKIGLLVGLAFIIVVAILLSDPVNNAGEPPAAILDTASTVRQGVTVLAPTAPPANDRSTTAIIAPTRAPSREPILTRTEAEQQTPQTVVSVGPGRGALTPIIPAPAPSQRNDDSQVTMQQGASGQDSATVTPTPPTRTSTDTLQQVAANQGESIVSTDQHDPIPATPAPAAAGSQRYTAQPGDSVSRMASRLMGGNTKANRAAIIAANPSLKQNPNRVIVGAVYTIPSSASSDSDAVAPAPASTDTAQAPAPADNQSTRWYVVKPNDNLWRIATAEVGDASAVAQIISLNKDILKGGSTIQPNMRLRLPPKTMASAD